MSGGREGGREGGLGVITESIRHDDESKLEGFITLHKY